jgi:diacylglycerol kinase (ATP)
LAGTGTRVVLLTNPRAGSAGTNKWSQAASVLQKIGPVSTLRPDPDSLAPELSAFVGEGDLLVVAGGDGTVGDAVNALEDRLDRIELAILPMGTGNDLASTLRLPTEPAEAARAILEGTARRLDVGVATSEGLRRLFVNSCIGGFPVQVDRAVSEPAKRRLGPLAFTAGALKAATDLRRWSVQLDGSRVDDCVAVGVGNGRTGGGGMPLWPHADPGDGELDAVALPAAGTGSAIRLALRVRAGTHGSIDGVVTSRGPWIQVDADPPMEFNVDGELPGIRTPARFEVAARASVRVPPH